MSNINESNYCMCIVDYRSDWIHDTGPLQYNIMVHHDMHKKVIFNDRFLYVYVCSRMLRIARMFASIGQMIQYSYNFNRKDPSIINSDITVQYCSIQSAYRPVNKISSEWVCLT